MLSTQKNHRQTLTHHHSHVSFIPPKFMTVCQVQCQAWYPQKQINVYTFISPQCVFEAQKFTGNATLLRKARSTSTKPTKTAFPREGRWLSPGAPTRSMPSETTARGACQVSMTFGWASMTWSRKASFSMSTESPFPSSTGTVHSPTVASGKTASSSPSQLRGNGATRPVAAARGTSVSSPSPNRPSADASSKQDRT